MKTFTWIASVVALVTTNAYLIISSSKDGQDTSNKIVILVPDGATSNLTTVWMQAASEEGITAQLMTFSEFKNPKTLIQRNFAGVIVPDTISKSGDDLLCDTLRQYVISGGKLMFVYDALTLNERGAYAIGRSRLSDLAGVDYALYDTLHAETMSTDVIVSTPRFLTLLGITPGRYGSSLVTPSDNDNNFDQQFTAYGYSEQRYPYFQTDAHNLNKPLLRTRSGHTIATTNDIGYGKSLFVNLPIGLLATKTDRQLLQGFLRYFTDDVAVVPKLIGSPGGTGGIILNIHVDSYRGIKELADLGTLGVLDQGPYSIHFTAGPDVDFPGDGLGMDVEHNEHTRNWIRRLKSQGHAIGSHGGWIHNYFAERLNESNENEFKNYLIQNKTVLEQLTGKPVTEYSSPSGNQPSWVTRWLKGNGIVAYYTTSNLGSGPIRPITDSGTVDRTIWEIPVTPVGKHATFEEAMAAKIPVQDITNWLRQVTEFVANTRSVRQIYFHPPGVYHYRVAVREWMSVTKFFSKEKKFNWYTMTGIADFMTRRENVRWESSLHHGMYFLRAEHPQSLKDMAFKLPLSHCPQIRQSKAILHYERGKEDWYVTIGNVSSVQIECLKND